MGTSTLIRETIHASATSDRIIPLGIRAGLFGSPSFCDEMSRILAGDSDLASVQVVDRAHPSDMICGIHVLLAEAGTSSLGVQGIEFVGLVAVIGHSLGDYASLPNAMLFPPLERTRPNQTIKTIKEKAVEIRLQEFAGLLTAFVTDSETDPQDLGQDLVIRSEREEKSLPTSSIDWIRAAGSHVEIRAGANSYVHRSEMHTLEHSLPSSFIRIHRRVIVNLRKVVKIDRENAAKLFARFADGTRFAISRHRRNRVEKLMNEIRGYSV